MNALTCNESIDSIRRSWVSGRPSTFLGPTLPHAGLLPRLRSSNLLETARMIKKIVGWSIVGLSYCFSLFEKREKKKSFFPTHASTSMRIKDWGEKARKGSTNIIFFRERVMSQSFSSSFPAHGSMRSDLSTVIDHADLTQESGKNEPMMHDAQDWIDARSGERCAHHEGMCLIEICPSRNISLVRSSTSYT